MAVSGGFRRIPPGSGGLRWLGCRCDSGVQGSGRRMAEGGGKSPQIQKVFLNTNDTWLAPAHGKGNASSGPTFRSKLLRRLASRLAIIASKHFVYKLGIQSGTLHAWSVVVASLLPWLTMARACFAASYSHRITEGRALFFENC